MSDTTFTMTAAEFKIISSIIGFWDYFERMPTSKQVKLDLDRPNDRWSVKKIEKVYKILESYGFVTCPGAHTGLRQSTKAGRNFFKKFLGSYPG